MLDTQICDACGIPVVLLDLLLDDAELAGQLLAEPHHLAIGFLSLVGYAHRPQQPLLGEDRQLAAVQPGVCEAL